MDIEIPDKWIELENCLHGDYDFRQEYDLFLKMLDDAGKENDIQRYIKDNKKYFIPASIFKDYNLGGKNSFVIPEESLGSSYRVDYLLVSSNSLGPQFVFVEFEDVNVEYKQEKRNSETLYVRKGLDQIREWNCWLSQHFDYFLNESKLDNLGKPNYGSIHFCLVVSRRKYMNKEANSLRGYMMQKNVDLKIITYDHLADNIKSLGKGF